MNQAPTPAQPEPVEGYAPPPAPKPKSSWINLLVDYGPLIVWFAVYRWSKPADGGGIGEVLAVTKSTLAFMVATVLALAISKWRLGKVSPMLWLSSVLIVGFGGLTVFLNDPFYIQIKPTVIYLFFAATLFGGLLRGKAMLKYLLQSAFEGLSDEGWRKLSRNWAVWFVVLAIANEVLRRAVGFDEWLTIKVWGVSIASFLFTFAQIPMLLRHGLGEEQESEVESHPPQG